MTNILGFLGRTIINIIKWSIFWTFAFNLLEKGQKERAAEREAMFEKLRNRR
mgnify:CR=1 FL=1